MGRHWAALLSRVSTGPVPGVCPKGQQWLDCAQGPASCAHLSTPRETNQTCQPGCYCLPGMLLLVSIPNCLARTGTASWPGTLVWQKRDSQGPGQAQSQRLGARDKNCCVKDALDSCSLAYESSGGSQGFIHLTPSSVCPLICPSPAMC